MLITEISVAEVPETSAAMKADGARFVQLLALKSKDGCDLIYSFMLADNTLTNYRVCGLTAADVVPSITDKFLAAFVFENEAHDLFGVNFAGIAIDFGGKFYDVTAPTPMNPPAANAEAKEAGNE